MFLDPPAAFVVGEGVEWWQVSEVFCIIERVVLTMDNVICRGRTGRDQHLSIAVINRRADFANADILSQVDWLLGYAYNLNIT